MQINKKWLVVKKYSRKTIADYINGEALDYKIDELENDPKFMMLVIDFINDKNFYNLCSDEVKKITCSLNL